MRKDVMRIMLTLPKRKIKRIGPLDHGRKLSLSAFEFAKTEEGYHYELSRGYIVVSEVANYWHAFVVVAIRNSLIAYQFAHPKTIHMILTEMANKLVIPEWDSERHPDIAVYLTRPKQTKGRKLWRTWIPEFVIEVVSAWSDHRDYIEKRVEYWTLGVQEYWIVDPRKQLVVMLKRGKSDWIEKRAGRDAACGTKLLPGYKLELAPIFDALGSFGDGEE